MPALLHSYISHLDQRQTFRNEILKIRIFKSNEFLLFQDGEQADYECVEGYRVEGENNNDQMNSSMLCTANDTFAAWDQMRPNCERKL